MVFNKKSTDFVDGFGFSGLKMETLSWRWINIICTRKSSNGRDSSNILQTPGEPVQKVFQNFVFALQWYALFVAETRYNTVPCLHPMMKLIRPKRWQPWSTLCVFSPIPTIPVPAGRSCCEYCWGNQWILIMTKRGNPELTTPNWSRFALKCLIQFWEASHKARHIFGMILSTDILGKWSSTSSRSQKKCR